MMHPSIQLKAARLLMALLLATAGCAERGERLEPKGFPLQIALSGPLPGPLPDDLLALTLPFQGEACKGVVLTPVVQFVRLDVETPKPVDLKPELDWIAQLQEKVHAGSLQQRRGSVERGLRRAVLPAELAATGAPMTSSAEAKLEALLSPVSREKAVWVLSDEKDADTTNEAFHGRVFHQAATFQKDVGEELCGRATRGEELPGYYVLYRPAGTASPLVAVSPPPAREESSPEARLPSLAEVRQNLEDGRLDDAQRALGAFRVAQPESSDAEDLDRDLHAKLQARILLRKPDGFANQLVFTDPASITVPVGAQERRFRVQIEPEEAVYVYLYGEYSDGSVVSLFAPNEQKAEGALVDGREYLLPSDSAAYDLSGDGGARLTGLYAVATRWRARDLERFNVRLGGGDPEAAAELRNALRARQQAALGGCDVRAVRFQAAEKMV